MLHLGTRLIAATALALIASLLSPAPTQAATVTWRAVITFDKNQQQPLNSQVRWQLWRVVDGTSRLVEKAQWRAGSGMGGKRGRNSCINDVGWLPNGTYRVKHHRNYRGRLIKGRAFQVDDKRCRTGNRRFALFIHTEQGDRSRQCRNRPGDQPCRWEYPRYNDYKSAGCIKMSPRDLTSLSSRYTRVFRSGVRHAKSTVVLRVVD